MQLIDLSTFACEPLVSVIMCVRDGERYIGEALDGIGAQEITGVETLVVLDGSCDRSSYRSGSGPAAGS